MTDMTDSALVVVDMLYDFIDGSLACLNSKNAVREAVAFIDRMTAGQSGDENEILDTFPILFVCDHHPAGHCSFTSSGGTWPSHCVAGTHGGAVHEMLQPYMKEELTFYKGCDIDREQYSGFEGANRAGQTLGEILELMDTKDVYVCGIATEFCVRATCLDLPKAGISVHRVAPALADVDEAGHNATLRELEASGVRIVHK